MSAKQPLKRHRFPAVVILWAVRMYLHYPLSYQDVADLLAERGLDVDRSTIFRWVQKFGPKLSKRVERHLSRTSLTHIDRKYLNNRVESVHVALKRLLGYRQSFRSLRCAKATLLGMETIRTIKNGHRQTRQPGVRGEISFVHELTGFAS